MTPPEILNTEPVVAVAGVGVALVELLVVGLALTAEQAGPVSAVLYGLVGILAPVAGSMVARLYAWSGASVDAEINRTRSLAYSAGASARDTDPETGHQA